MNDELNNQLCTTWQVPAYAQGALYIEDMHGKTVRAEGEAGMFKLENPSSAVNLRWGTPGGAILGRFEWQPDSLGWDGTVRMGGYVDAIHTTALPGLDMPVVIAYMGGYPLKSDLLQHLHVDGRILKPHNGPDFHSGLLSDLPEQVTTWLVADESPLATAAHDALMNNLRLYFFGALAEEDSGWGNLFSLPLILQAVTVFAP